MVKDVRKQPARAVCRSKARRVALCTMLVVAMLFSFANITAIAGAQTLQLRGAGPETYSLTKHNFVPFTDARSANGKNVAVGAFKSDGGVWYLVLGSTLGPEYKGIQSILVANTAGDSATYPGPDILIDDWHSSITVNSADTTTVTFDASWAGPKKEAYSFYAVPLTGELPQGGLTIDAATQAGGFDINGASYNPVRYNVSYQFVSGTTGHAVLPQAVMDLLPAATTAEDQMPVTPPAITQDPVPVPGGAWTFQSWDSPSKIVDGADLLFTGTWTYEAVSRHYNVRYAFMSGTTGRDLPQAVLDLLPAATTAADKTIVTPKKFTKTDIKTAEGTWKFQGWDADSKTIDGSNITFTGVWKFTPKPQVTYAVKYAFVSGTPGRDLPDALSTFLPGDATAADGAVIYPKDPSRTIYATEGGTWTFEGWEPARHTIAGADVTFTGVWTYKKNATPIAPSKPTTITPVSSKKAATNTANPTTGDPQAGIATLASIGILLTAGTMLVSSLRRRKIALP